MVGCKNYMFWVWRNMEETFMQIKTVHLLVILWACSVHFKECSKIDEGFYVQHFHSKVCLSIPIGVV